MEKIRVTLDEIIGAYLLRFGRIDDEDITLLINEFRKSMDITMPNDCDKYFFMNDGSIILQPKCINQINRRLNNGSWGSENLSNLLERLDNIDMMWFVLMKVKLLGCGCILPDDLVANFNKLQLECFKKLYNLGYITKYSHNDFYGNYQSMRLTKRGEVYLFMLENSEALDKFSLELYENGYDNTLISAYLITLDLDSETLGSVFEIDKFLDFCAEYDIDPSVEKEDGFSRVKSIN